MMTLVLLVHPFVLRERERERERESLVVDWFIGTTCTDSSRI
jgi:hypothetical protein